MDTIEPPAILRANILMNIEQVEYRRAKVFLLVSVPFAMLSIVGVVFSMQYMLQEFYQSSFQSYLSLLISDTSIVFAYWSDFASSLVDAMPFVWITVFLVTIASFLVSVKIFVDNLRSGLSISFIHS